MRQRLGWEHCQFVTWHTLMTEVCPGVVGHLKNVENSLDGHTQSKVEEGQHGLISHVKVTIVPFYILTRAMVHQV